MYILTSYSLAVFCCFISMLAWGSWPNTQKLTGSWRFELFYWDFVAGILVFSALWALTLGSNGPEGRSFIADLSQGTVGQIASAVFGGFIWNLANLLLVAAIAFAGLAMAFSVGTGIGWIMGILINYYFAPVGNAGILFLGAGFIAIAIVLSMAAYKRIPTDDSSSSKNAAKKGIMFAVAGGLLISWYYRFVASSIASSFVAPEAGKLTPYTAVFLFSFGVFSSTFVFNGFLMKRPMAGVPLSFSDYRRGSLRVHALGWAGGFIWCLALSLSFLSSEKAGFAISYGLGNGATMVGILWGIVVWKEFRRAPAGTDKLLALMIAIYCAGLAMIVYSRVA